MDKLFNILRKVRSFCLISSPDYFVKEQNKTYTGEEILQSFQQVTTGTRFSENRSLKVILKHLHCILFYVCNSQAYDRQIQEFIQHNELALVLSTIQIIRLYQSYLKKILPTNATYFHFLRDSEFYFHYVVVRYVLIIGDSHHLRNISQTSIYSKINSELKKSIFSLLIEWLFDLIDYHNSAIYVENTAIEHLINSTFILVCGLLGPSQQNTFSLLEKGQKKDLFNKLMFISIYVLCNTINHNKRNKYYLVSMSINCLRKMLVQKDIPDIQIFIPSYLYVDMIGFINCPLTYEIVMRVLVCFLNEGFERDLKLKQSQKKYSQENHDEQRSSPSQHQDSGEQLFFVSPLTEINIWGVINLIIEKYGTYNKKVLQSFLTKIIPSIQPQSLVRAYCVKIIKQLDLVKENHILSNFYKKSQYDYLVDDKLLSVDLVINNFGDFMEAIYSSNVQQAVMEKQVVLTAQNIFKYLLEFNVDLIKTLKSDDQNVEKNFHQNELNSGQKFSKNFVTSQQNLKKSFKNEKQLDSLILRQQKNQNNFNQQDPHLNQSQFYEKRNKSGLYQSNQFGQDKNRFLENQLQDDE